GKRRRRRREDRRRGRSRSLPRRRSDGSRSGRHLFCQIHFPYDEPDHAKSDDNPRSSIHKFGFARSDAATDLILRSAGPARRHRVVSTSTPWLAASEALQSQPTSVPNAMRLHRFQKISRTGRGKSAAEVRTAKQTKQRRKSALIEANDKTNQSEHQSRIEARLARRNHSSSNASYLAVAASCLAIITNQTPCRSSCWCRRTISRKRRRTRLRMTAPPRRPEVTNPARHGPEFSTGMTFNISSLARCVMPSRFTRSYSERCVRRRAFGKENG